ncbi:MAG: hypothetical protein KUG79_10145 [Pseudomonadales bacterium]|nr:hypothetical protein [Pseudomonadales bacterium]
MWGCNSLIWFAIAAGLIGAAIFISKYFQNTEAEIPTDGLITRSSMGLGFILLGTVLAVTSSYLSCSFKVAPCPAAIGGNGYICTNEGSGCFGITPGKCTTVAGTYFWESPCECDCD